MKDFRQQNHGFSMVEVAIAVGLLAFVLLSLLALLPLGMKNNKVSAEETRAVFILSALEADLRNTHPSANGGHSAIFGLDLPYGLNANGSYAVNPLLTGPTTSLGAGSTTGLDEGENPVSVSGRPRFQASVIYTAIPPSGAPGTLQARLVVNWPAVSTSSVNVITDAAKVEGFVETLVSFPTP